MPVKLSRGTYNRLLVIVPVLCSLFLASDAGAQWDVNGERDDSIAGSFATALAGGDAKSTFLSWLADNQSVVYYGGRTIYILNTAQKTVSVTTAPPIKEAQLAHPFVAVVASDDRSTIAVVYADVSKEFRTVRYVGLFDSSGKFLRSIPLPENSDISQVTTRLALTADGKTAVVTTDPGAFSKNRGEIICVFDVGAGVPKHTFQVPFTHIELVSLSADAKYLATYDGYSEKLIFWNLDTGEGLPGPAIACHSLHFSPARPSVVAIWGIITEKSGQRSKAIVFWDVVAGEPVQLILQDGLGRIHFSKDGRILVTLNELRYGILFALFDAETGKQICEHRHPTPMSAVALSADSQRLAVFSSETDDFRRNKLYLRLWDAHTCTEIPFGSKKPLRLEEVN